MMLCMHAVCIMSNHLMYYGYAEYTPRVEFFSTYNSATDELATFQTVIENSRN